MKSGLIVQTSVGMRNVLAKKTLRSDAQPLSNRVATRMCAFDRPRQRRGAHDARAPGGGSGIGVSGTELFATIGRRVLGRGGAAFAFP